jgi:hypothetical protein
MIDHWDLGWINRSFNEQPFSWVLRFAHTTAGVRTIFANVFADSIGFPSRYKRDLRGARQFGVDTIEAAAYPLIDGDGVPRNRLRWLMTPTQACFA